MNADRAAEQFVREGTPPFVGVYDRILDHIRALGLRPGDSMPSDDALAGALGVPRELIRESLLLLQEDGQLARGRDRLWVVAPRQDEAVTFTDSFHRVLGGRARPVRRLLVAIEDGSHWSHELLRDTGRLLVWETVFAVNDVLLASTLEMMVLDAAPPELVDQLVAAKHDLAAWPTMLEALGPERRAGLAPDLWRLTQVSRNTERLSWMDLPLHGIPAGLTVLLSEDGRPVYLAKNLFDLGSLNLVVDVLGPTGP